MRPGYQLNQKQGESLNSFLALSFLAIIWLKNEKKGISIYGMPYQVYYVYNNHISLFMNLDLLYEN